METLKAAVDAMRPDCFFGSVDLSEAFYSIPIRESDRKYFRFIFNGQKYQFTALVMGLATSPRVFTKVLKPVLLPLGPGALSVQLILMTAVYRVPLLMNVNVIFCQQSN